MMCSRRRVLGLGLAGSLAACSEGKTQALPSVSVQEAQRRLADGKAVLVDIRRPEEWAETGVAQGAIKLDMTAADFAPRLQALSQANPGKDIDLICRTANRSGAVQKALAAQGWRHVVNVRGGMAGNFNDTGWIKAGLPVVK